MIRQLNPFSIQIPKGFLGSFVDTLVNNHQQVFKLTAPEAKDILFSARGHIISEKGGPGPQRYKKIDHRPT